MTDTNYYGKINGFTKNDMHKIGRGGGVNIKLYFIKKYSVLFGCFVDLSEMIECIDNIFGWSYILELIQDFILLLIQYYFVMHIIFEENAYERKMIYLIGVGVWSIGHFGKMYLSNIVNVTIKQVDINLLWRLKLKKSKRFDCEREKNRDFYFG